MASNNRQLRSGNIYVPVTDESPRQNPPRVANERTQRLVSQRKSARLAENHFGKILEQISSVPTCHFQRSFRYLVTEADDKESRKEPSEKEENDVEEDEKEDEKEDEEGEGEGRKSGRKTTTTTTQI